MTRNWRGLLQSRPRAGGTRVNSLHLGKRRSYTEIQRQTGFHKTEVRMLRRRGIGRKAGVLACAGLLAAGSLFSAVLVGQAKAEEAAPAEPNVDALLDELVKLKPEQVAAKLAELKQQLADLQAQAVAKRQEADRIDAQTKASQERLAALEGHVKALAGLFAAPAEGEATMMAAAAPAPSPAPAEPMKEEAAKAVTVNFAEHILPIVKARCASCHNEDKRRGGLSLESHASALAGGSSGAVIAPGDPDGSRLLRLVMRVEEPNMPPSGDPLTEEQINLIREWIAQGAPADASAKVMASEKKTATDAPVFVAASFSDTPPVPEKPLPAPSTEVGKPVVARAVAASPRAEIVAVGGYRQVLVYSLENNQLLGALPFPEGDILTLTFSVNGEVLLAGGGEPGASGIVVAWNIRTGERMGQYGEGYDTVLAADISPDHTMVAVGGPNKVVRVYSAKDGSELYKLDAHTDWIYAVKFSPDGELLASADRAGTLLLWQAANGRPVEALRGHTGAINGLAYSADSVLLASAGQDGTVQIWDTWKYKKVRGFTAHPSGVLSVDYANNGELVTTGADKLTKRWDAAGKNVATYEGLPDWGYQARFDAEDKLVLAGAWTGDVFVWKADTAEKVAALSTAPQ
jgi:WD40 repeat protein/FtsZ-binding cell division protein ZapB